MNRRTLLKSGAGVTVATAGAGIGWLLIDDGAHRARARATLQTEGLTADNVTVSSNNGKLTTLTLDPSLTIEWDDLPRPVHFFSFQIWVRTGQTQLQNVFADVFSDVSPSTSGSESVDVGEVNTLRENRSGSAGLYSPTFTDPTEGDGPKETDVTVVVAVYFGDDDGINIDPPNTESDHLEETVTFTVSVNNEGSSGSATISGTLNTAGS